MHQARSDVIAPTTFDTILVLIVPDLVTPPVRSLTAHRISRRCNAGSSIRAMPKLRTEPGRRSRGGSAPGWPTMNAFTAPRSCSGNSSGMRFATRPALELTLDWSGAAPVLHVIDNGPGFKHVPTLPRDVYSESCRGLFLISSLSEEFNVAKRAESGSHARAVLSLERRSPGTR